MIEYEPKLYCSTKSLHKEHTLKQARFTPYLQENPLKQLKSLFSSKCATSGSIVIENYKYLRYNSKVPEMLNLGNYQPQICEIAYLLPQPGNRITTKPGCGSLFVFLASINVSQESSPCII